MPPTPSSASPPCSTASTQMPICTTLGCVHASWTTPGWRRGRSSGRPSPPHHHRPPSPTSRRCASRLPRLHPRLHPPPRQPSSPPSRETCQSPPSRAERKSHLHASHRDSWREKSQTLPSLATACATTSAGARWSVATTGLRVRRSGFTFLALAWMKCRREGPSGTAPIAERSSSWACRPTVWSRGPCRHHLHLGSPPRRPRAVSGSHPPSSRQPPSTPPTEKFSQVRRVLPSVAGESSSDATLLPRRVRGGLQLQEFWLPRRKALGSN